MGKLMRGTPYKPNYIRGDGPAVFKQFKPNRAYITTATHDYTSNGGIIHLRKKVLGEPPEISNLFISNLFKTSLRTRLLRKNYECSQEKKGRRRG